MPELNDISLGLTPEEWKQVGAYANSLIQNDMVAGKFQNNESGLHYKSKEYVQYKKIGMQRLTKDTKKGRKSVFQKTGIGNGLSDNFRKKIGKSGRLKAYAGKPISSTNTSYVDMTLTGTLKKSLHVVRAWLQGVECGYRPDDHAAGKIEGNRKLGREILGLSDENQEKVKAFIQQLIEKRVQGFNQKINIDVKF